MKKIFIILIVLLWLTSCNKTEEQVVKKYYSTWTVLTWSVTESDSYIWYIQSQDSLSLSSKMPGKIKKIYFDESDIIEKWDLLAEIDYTQTSIWYNTSKKLLESLMQMKSDTRKMFDGQIIAMQSKVKQTIAWEQGIISWLDDTKKVTQTQLDTAKTSVELAEQNLEQTKLVLDTKQKHIYENSKNAIVSAVILDTNIIKFVDELLWVTDENEDKNDSFQDYLWVKDLKNLREAKEMFLEVNKLYLEYKYFYNTEIEDKNPSEKLILKWLDSWEKLAEKIKVLLDLVYNVLDTSIDNVHFAETTISEYKTTVSTYWTSVESSLVSISWDFVLWLKWSRQSLDDFEKTKNMQISILEKQLSLANDTYTQYKAQSDAQITEVITKKEISSNQVDEIESSLESLKKQKQVKLAELDLKIEEINGQISNMLSVIKDHQIVSPIDWVISSRLLDEWENVWWFTPVFILENKDNLEIEISISESVSKKVELWDTVFLDIEWLDKKQSGIIVNILPSKDIFSKKILLKISVDNTDKNIKIWSMVKVSFLFTDNTLDSLIIPNKAIINKFMLPGVFVLEDNKAVFKNIEIINSNNELSEIKWLKLWDTIILEWKENIWDGEELNY